MNLLAGCQQEAWQSDVAMAVTVSLVFLGMFALMGFIAWLDMRK